ncbi:MAG: NYN domain-containing protein [Castellaniella sp.]
MTNDDFYYSARQKGVDIKLGIDIATLSIRGQVDKIVLVSGDSDFVPAAKLARINGVNFVLDAMRNQVDPSLYEHIDGLVNFDIVSILKKVLRRDPDVKPTRWDNEEQGPVSGRQRRARSRKNRKTPRLTG